jgi:sensor histidine kinase YesM
MKLPLRFSLPGSVPARARWTYLLTMPWFAALFSYLMVGPGYLQDLPTFAGATLLNALLLTGTFAAQNQVSEVIAQRFARFDQTVSRIAWSLGAHVLLSAVFLGLIGGLYLWFRWFGSTLTVEKLLTIYLVNLATLFLATGIKETFHSIGQWKQHQMNKERLKKEMLQGQLQGLKNQVNPHFLFNSLNSLSSLIADEPERAEQFVDEMARVYRYLLQTNQSTGAGTAEGLTTLAQELAFIDSYYHLLKTRHGVGLELRVEVADAYHAWLLPPLTLQLLVENAVKHNVVSPSRPLQVEIRTTEADSLEVRNTLQRKTSRFASTRVGLANITAKYQLLTQSAPRIEDGPTHFTVSFPLLSPDAFPV